MPYVPGTAGDQPIRVGLEHLNDVDLAALERIGVLRHGRVRRAAERDGISLADAACTLSERQCV